MKKYLKEKLEKIKFPMNLMQSFVCYFKTNGSGAHGKKGAARESAT